MRNLLLLLLLSSIHYSLFSQTGGKSSTDEKRPSSSSDIIFNPDATSVTNSEITVNGQRVPFKAITGTLPVWDEEGKTIAGLFFTYYSRTDVKDIASRPMIISFNGGPGSASVWMHIAYTGPVILNIDDEGYPIQPYGFKDNPFSILDVADIVYVDPVNTGFSRITNKDVPKSKFFGVNADIKYLADWVTTFITRYNRWASPKYLIGESYGTTRVSGLAQELQSNHWMYLNGVILVSPTDLGMERSVPQDAALRLPYFTATAWYHKKLSPELQARDLTDVLNESESYTLNQLVGALNKGNLLTDDERMKTAAQMSRYSGIDSKVFVQNNLNVSTNLFWKELMRDEGFTVGRLDSRYRGIDLKDAGNGPEYNAELTSWLHSFTPPINMYLREKLGYKTDLQYNMFGPVRPWDNSNDNTGASLAAAMAINPGLYLMVQSGYYDGACDYFNAKYNMWQMDPAGKLKDRMVWKGYRSGHMMYLRKEDLQASNQHIRDFIKMSLAKSGASSKY